MHLTTRQIRDIALVGGLVATGAALARAFSARTQPRDAAFSRRAADDVGRGTVRTAGPEAMRDPPRDWSRADEFGDESFPASDPPATY